MATAGASVPVTDGSLTVAGTSVTAAAGALAGAAAAARAMLARTASSCALVMQVSPVLS